MEKPKDPPTSSDLLEHPSIRLLHALNGLHQACFNVEAFRDMYERRKRKRKAWIDRQNVLAQFDPLMAHQRADEPLPDSESAESIGLLRGLLQSGQQFYKEARDALAAKGGEVLDAALAPGTSVNATEIGIKVEEAEDVFCRLNRALDGPDFVVDDQIAKMTELRDWFAAERDRLGVVMEQRGLGVPMPSNGAGEPIAMPTELLVKLAADLAALRAEVVSATRSATPPHDLPAVKPSPETSRADESSTLAEVESKPQRRGYREATEFLLEHLRRGGRWTQHNDMARIANCLPSVLTNALKQSEELRAFRDEADIAAAETRTITPPVGLEPAFLADEHEADPSAAVESAEPTAIREAMLSLLMGRASEYAKCRILGLNQRDRDQVCDKLAAAPADDRHELLTVILESIDSEKPSITPSLRPPRSVHDCS
ncbi:MAG: hypothetical protein ACKVW3_02910 [Phycisphaerales bacterium]